MRQRSMQSTIPRTRETAQKKTKTVVLQCNSASVEEQDKSRVRNDLRGYACRPDIEDKEKVRGESRALLSPWNGIEQPEHLLPKHLRHANKNVHSSKTTNKMRETWRLGDTCKYFCYSCLKASVLTFRPGSPPSATSTPLPQLSLLKVKNPRASRGAGASQSRFKCVGKGYTHTRVEDWMAGVGPKQARHCGHAFSGVSDLASCPAFLLSGLVPIRLESSLRLYPTVNPQAAFNQSTHVEVKRTAGRPRLKQPRLPSTTSRPLIAGMLVDSPGTVELELWAMKSMSHDCAREPYTYKIQCSGSRILDGRQFFASHHEEYAIFFRPSIAVSRIQSRIMVIRKATEWGMTHEIEIDSVSSSGWVLFITVLGIWEVIVMNALELPAHSSARLHNVCHRYTFSTPAITFTSRGMGDREVGRLRTCAKCYQQGSPTSDVHSPLSSHRGVPVSRILQNSRSTGSLLKDNTECVGEMRTFDMVQQVKSEGRCGTDAGCVLRPYRSPSTRSTRVSQSRTPQTNYTLIPERYSNRFGQESHIDACTPALHAWIPHEFCCGLITSPPLSEQASDIQEA
ncbi:hypothetical protein BKA70DRAFT_1466302 [Coprinopsis sp. MPI-PUGE-AT-0042]|nr:hypothetical protein BKA70DRAFT_1466302 [Coprinopsis sp. MPI-PUGE-AT-0042]